MEALQSYEAWGDLHGQNILVRVDFNCPVELQDGTWVVTDDFRIRATVPLFEDLLAKGATVTACTHFGRPKGQVVAEYSVQPLRDRLNELCPGVTLLENLRFSPGEEANDFAFGASLVEGFDRFINEAFSASHRAHASIMVPPQLIPSAAGPTLLREVATLNGLLTAPERPFVAIVGGAKVKDKLGIVKVLSEKADKVLVGGGMAYTFEATQGRAIGKSLFDASYLDECAALMATGKMVIPVDTVTLPFGVPFGPAGGPDVPVVVGRDVPDNDEGFDIGPESRDLFVAEIAKAATILWNGPMGVFEDPRLGAGTEAVARAVAASSAVSVIGGGDSVAAIQALNLQDQVTFVSTGGGASLEFVEQGDLPGLQALRDGMH